MRTFCKKFRAEQEKLHGVRTLLRAYDNGNIDREHLEAGLIHLFLPTLSRSIHAVQAAKAKAEALIGSSK